MSFLKPKDTIDEGDTVILYLSVNSMHVIEATPTIVNKRGETIEHIFQTSFGALKVKNIIGVKYGSRVELSKGWAYVYNQILSYGLKHFHIGHKSFILPILV